MLWHGSSVHLRTREWPWVVGSGLGACPAVSTKGMSDPSPSDLWWLRDLDLSGAVYMKTPWRFRGDVVRVGEGMGWSREVGSAEGFTASCCAPRLGANTFPQSIPLSKRDVQAGEVDSQLPFSPSPPWRMLQLHLCPGAGVCWRRRSRRWADEITEAKAGREWIPTPQIFSIVFSVTELGKIEHHRNGAEPALPCALGNRSQKLPIYISSAAASLNPRTDTG